MPQYFSAHFVLDSSEALSTIKDEFDRYEKVSGLVFFVFCPRSSRYYDQLAKGADFWNRYSDKYVTILFPGYVGYLSCPEEEFRDNVQTDFSFDDFKEFSEKIEQKTTWTYQGGTDLIGVMAKKQGSNLTFDYGNAIVVNIDTIDFDGKFDFSRYMIELINSAKASPENPLPEIGKRSALDFIVSVVRIALPGQLRRMLEVGLKCNLRRNISRTT